MAISKNHTEPDLFKKIAEGDERAFQKIFHQYNRRLFPFVVNMVKSKPVAEEIVSGVFLKLWLNKESVAAKDNPVAWLFTVASNQTLTYLKRISTEYRIIRELKSGIREYQDSTNEAIQFKETKNILIEAVKKLPLQRRRIYKLSREEGLNYKEIAEQLHISPNTVKNQLVTALRSIRVFLHKTGTFFF